MLKLLFASSNPGKFHEVHSLLDDLPIHLFGLQDLGLENMNVLEDGKSYAENAILKALAYGRAANLLTLADDSGLEVDALDGAPGIYSARYSPKPQATDADRRLYLVEQLRGFSQPWQARFRCSIALAAPDGTLEVVEGICPGEIIPDERGYGGFGYDPIFLLPSLGRSMAELTLQEKNSLSHRARAVIAIRPFLLSWIERG